MKKFTLAISLVMILSGAFAQLTVQNGYTAQQLGNILAGPNITVTNPSITGAAVQFGTFAFNGSGFPLSSGILLTTGSIFNAHGPNSSGSMTTGNGMPGYAPLTNIAGVNTEDAVVFSIDFTVQSDQIEFRYLFASEEYNEFVGSQFNDVFAFFISGPGITGTENIALVPNTTVPVAINNINLGSYWQYYNNNESGTTNIEFDGYTTVLTAKKTGLIPCSTYHLTLAIADAGDGAFDSGVFLQANSLVQGNVSASPNTYSANNTALEGCIDASFTFALDSVLGTDTYISYDIGGTAINGVDYAHIDSMLVIPAGQLSATVIIDAISDGIAEGTENVELYFSPAPCQPLDTVKLHISDYQALQFTSIPNNLSCFESGDGEIAFNISGGTPPFTVILTDTSTDISTTYTTLPITGLSQGTYHVRILDAYGCYAEDIVNGGYFDADTTFLPDGTGVSYSTSLVISGFLPGQTLTDVNQIVSICANMEHSYANDLDIKLRAPNNALVMLKNVGPTGGAINANNFGEPVASGTVDNWSTNVVPGVGYDYCWTNTPTYLTMNQMVSGGSLPYYTYVSTFGNTLSDYYLPSGSYTSVQPLSGFLGTPLNGTWTLIVTDHYAKDNGYIFNWSISLSADIPDSIITITQPNQPTVNAVLTNPSCGASTGVINITVTNGVSPYTFHWSNNATTEDINGLAAGNYTVTVTDANSCHFIHTYSLPNSSAASITQVVTDQQCPGTNSGSINITVTGGTPGYTYLWSNSATTQDINNLAPGNYSVQVTDQAGCISAASYTINSAINMVINSQIIDETCGSMDGAINITVIGGVPPLFYEWSNNKFTEDLADLQQGTYSVTVIDNHNCEVSQTFNVVNLVGNCIPDCDLVIQNLSTADEICGNSNGSISLNIFTTNLPYQVTWSNGSHAENLTSLSAGSYTVTITDNVSCSVIQTFTLNNHTGTLAIQNASITDETCGNGMGAVNITPAGGALPYTYLWTGGVTTQDINNLSAGSYSVTLTDANNCNVYGTYSVLNITGGLTQTYGNAMNSSCGQNSGSIDITITGGSLPYTYNWSNGAHTEDLINLGPGNYSCEITDNSGCTIYTPDYTIINESGTLSFEFINAVNENCGNGLGHILISVTGGQLPYTYLWSTGATTQNIGNLSAGTYSCTVTDFTGCSLTSGGINIINEPGTLALTNVSTLNEICSNGLGSVQITVDGGTTPYAFHWNTGSTAQNIFGLSAGAYTCTVTDAAGCSFVVNEYVGNDAGSLQIANMVTLDEICGNGNGSINLVITGGAVPVSYLWTGCLTTQDISGLHAGTYYVTVTDVNGCQITGTTVINNQTGTLSVNINSVTNEICGNGAGSIQISVSGGDDPYSYSWSNSATTEDISGLSAGTYTCTITDSAGCHVSTPALVINNSSGGLSISSAVISDAVCTSLSGAINITTLGGSLPLTYHWSNSAITEDISGLAAGNYTVTITDNSGCSVVHIYTVPYSAGTLTLSNFLITDEICGNGSGVIDITVNGGTLPYTYNWSNSHTTQDINALSAGNYSVTITDANGCHVNHSNFTVTDNPGNFALTSISTLNEICGGDNGAISISLTGGTNPISYNWSNGGFTRDQNGLSSGVYTCTTTDANGCTLIYSATILNDPGNLSATPVITPENCGDMSGSIDLTVSGGTLPYSYLWNNNQTTQDINGLEGGSYTVNVTDLSGCLLVENFNVPFTDPVYVSSVSITDEACNNASGSIQVIVEGGTGVYTYEWEQLGGTSCCDYTLEMHDNNGNGWNGSHIDVSINGAQQGAYAATGFVTTAIIPVCEGDLLQLTYTTGMQDWQNSYSLFDALGVEIFISNSPPTAGLAYSDTAYCTTALPNSSSLSGLEAGDYGLTVTDANGCSLETIFTVPSSSGTMNISNAVIIGDTCANGIGSISISMSGGNPPFVYHWNTGAVTQSISGLFGGTYNITVTDQNNCEITQTYNIPTISGDMMVGTPIITSTYCGDSTGSIDISVSGGIPPYNYIWNTGAITEDLTSIASGTYSVTITDSVGCEDLRTYTVSNLTNGLAISYIETNEICGNHWGAIDLTISGGFSPYSILWNTSDTTEDISGLSQGTYTYIVMDSSGCIDQGSVIVANNPGNLSIANATVTNENCQLRNCSNNLTPSGGAAPLSYQWSNTATTEDISGLQQGSYTVTITDTNGCEVTGTYIITLYYSFDIIDTVITAATCITCPDGAINITPWGSGGPAVGMIYQWSNSASTEDINNVIHGIYTVTATDGYGCERVETYTVPYDTNYSISTIDAGKFVLFPNPTSDQFTIRWTLPEKSEVLIEIFNILGEKVIELPLNAGKSGNVRINMEKQNSGVYLIKISNGENYIIRKLTLQR